MIGRCVVVIPSVFTGTIAGAAPCPDIKRGGWGWGGEGNIGYVRGKTYVFTRVVSSRRHRLNRRFTYNTDRTKPQHTEPTDMEDDEKTHQHTSE